MSEHLTIEVQGTIDETIIKEIKGHHLQVASEKFLSGAEIVTVVLVPILSIVTEKVIEGIIDKIGISKEKFTIKYKGKVYKNLSASGAKKLITSIQSGHLPE